MAQEKTEGRKCERKTFDKGKKNSGKKRRKIEKERMMKSGTKENNKIKGRKKIRKAEGKKRHERMRGKKKEKRK